MFKRAGVTKTQRGAYSHEIRYNYDGSGDTFLVPIDGDGNAFTGGTWDVSTLVHEGDVDLQLKLVGQGVNEESVDSATAVQIGHSYLMSRQQIHSDTNVEADEGPGKQSILNALLGSAEINPGITDDIRAEARDAQDNPPYELIDLSDSGDVDHDITEPVELGRAIAGFGNAYGSTIVEIPFGLAKMRATVFDAADTNVTPSGLVCVEVLDIYEMQG